MSKSSTAKLPDTFPHTIPTFEKSSRRTQRLSSTSVTRRRWYSRQVTAGVLPRSGMTLKPSLRYSSAALTGSA